jgi:hypothetical protein
MIKALTQRATSFGPLDALYGAVRRGLPHAGAEVISLDLRDMQQLPDEPADALRVAYDQAGPWLIVWDDREGIFLWHDGPDAGAHLGPRDDLDHVVANIAPVLNIPYRP